MNDPLTAQTCALEPLPAFREYPPSEMLAHTPSPMGFLSELCGRPSSEKPVILLVVGYPAPGCLVPVHGGIKKPLHEIAQWLT